MLMEVEVEAKANGEDCLNQVRATFRKGVPASPREAWGLGDDLQEPGDVAAVARGARPGRQAPASSPRAAGIGGRRGRVRWGHPGPENQNTAGSCNPVSYQGTFL